MVLPCISFGTRLNRIDKLGSMSHSHRKTFIVLIVAILVWSEYCVAQHKGHMNDRCSQPPPSNVNILECCRTPDIVDMPIVEKCANRAYTLEEMIRANPSEPAFAPHFRVSWITSSKISDSIMLCCRTFFSPSIFYVNDFVYSSV